MLSRVVDQRRAFDQGGLQQPRGWPGVLAAEDVAGEARELVAAVAGAAQRGEHFVEDRLDVGQGGAGVDGQFAAAVTDVGGVAAGAIQPDPGFAGRLAGFPAQAGVGELAVVLLVEGEAARQAQFAALPVAQGESRGAGRCLRRTGASLSGRSSAWPRPAAAAVNRARRRTRRRVARRSSLARAGFRWRRQGCRRRPVRRPAGPAKGRMHRVPPHG